MRNRILAAALLLAAGCGDSGPTATTPMPPVAPAPPPTPDATASYVVTFAATWSAATHPNMFPSNPHFSGLIGATHRAGIRFWSPGAIATNGIEAMAELGSKTPLDIGIGRAIDNGNAEHLLSGDGIARSPGNVTLAFDISVEHPFVTLVSMVAPSPDWFVGVSEMSLFENGDWAAEIVVELQPYDAGTDSGNTYNAPDRDTVPRIPIAHLEGAPLAVGGIVAPVGTFTFRRQ